MNASGQDYHSFIIPSLFRLPRVLLHGCLFQKNSKDRAIPKVFFRLTSVDRVDLCKYIVHVVVTLKDSIDKTAMRNSNSSNFSSSNVILKSQRFLFSEECIGFELKTAGAFMLINDGLIKRVYFR